VCTTELGVESLCLKWSNQKSRQGLTLFIKHNPIPSVLPTMGCKGPPSMTIVFIRDKEACQFKMMIDRKISDLSLHIFVI
jgi:hypothetical protein